MEFMRTMGFGLIVMSILGVTVALIFGACLLLATGHYVLGGLALAPFFLAMTWVAGKSFE